MAFILSGCQTNTPSSRAKTHQAEFEQWAPEVQEAVLEGRVEEGFTPMQVRVAWGNPDHVEVETDEQGQTEVWIYVKESPGLGIGLGVGTGGGNVGVGTSVGTTVGRKTNVVAIARFRGGMLESWDRF